MNERPTVLELLDAAREHLQRKVVPAIDDPALRFQTLVAAHVIGVCAREIAAGSEATDANRLAFAKLLGAGATDTSTIDTMLCDAIRSGVFDGDAIAVIDALQRDVETALASWNPGFLERVRR